MHINIGIFGDQEVAKRLGKKTLLTILRYSHSSSEGVYTFILSQFGEGAAASAGSKHDRLPVLL
jgi:hypothetical protein